MARRPAARNSTSLRRNDAHRHSGMVRSDQTRNLEAFPDAQLRILRDALDASLPRKDCARLHHDTQPLRRPGDPGVEPARAAVPKRKALVEQHDVVPLRALRLVHGQRVAVVELVVGLALLPGESPRCRPRSIRRAPRPSSPCGRLLVRRDAQVTMPDFDCARDHHLPQAAVEQALLAVVAQADELVAGDRQGLLDVLLLRGCACCRRGGCCCGRPAPGRPAAPAPGRPPCARSPRCRRSRRARASRPSRTSIDRRMIGLSGAWRWTSVSITSGSASVKKPPPAIGGSCAGIAEHQHRAVEGQQVAAELLVDHRAFVDDDQLRLATPARRRTARSSAVSVAGFARPVDQRVDGAGVVAALGAHAPARPCR